MSTRAGRAAKRGTEQPSQEAKHEAGVKRAKSDKNKGKAAKGRMKSKAVPCQWARCALGKSITQDQPRHKCRPPASNPDGPGGYYHTQCYEGICRMREERHRLRYALTEKAPQSTVAAILQLVSSDDTLMDIASILTAEHGFPGKPEDVELSHCVRCHEDYDENYPRGCKILHGYQGEHYGRSRGEQLYGDCGCPLELQPDSDAYYQEHPEYDFEGEYCFEGEHTTSWVDLEEQAEQVETEHIKSCKDLGCTLPAHQLGSDDEDDDEDEDEA